MSTLYSDKLKGVYILFQLITRRPGQNLILQRMSRTCRQTWRKEERTRGRKEDFVLHMHVYEPSNRGQPVLSEVFEVHMSH